MFILLLLSGIAIVLAAFLIQKNYSSNEGMVIKDGVDASQDDDLQILPDQPLGFRELRILNTDISDEAASRLRHNFDLAISKIEESPGDTQAWATIGSIKYDVSDFEGAKDVWLYAIELNPYHAGVFANLAQIYWRVEGDYEKAEENLKRFIQVSGLDSSRIRGFRDLHELYKYSYEAKKNLADDILLEGLREHPNDEQLLILLADYYKEEGNTNAALIYYRLFFEEHPDDKSVADIISRLENEM